MLPSAELPICEGAPAVRIVQPGLVTNPEQGWFTDEPEWNAAAFWLWLPIAVAVTGYIALLLVVWCIDGMSNLGAGDGVETALLAALAVSPFVTFTLVYARLLRRWRRPAGRILVSAALTAPVAVVALFLRAVVSGGM